MAAWYEDMLQTRPHAPAPPTFRASTDSGLKTVSVRHTTAQPVNVPKVNKQDVPDGGLRRKYRQYVDATYSTDQRRVRLEALKDNLRDYSKDDDDGQWSMDGVSPP
eukprot:jgi/Mesvir1/18780/Mv01286-RA.1